MMPRGTHAGRMKPKLIVVAGVGRLGSLVIDAVLAHPGVEVRILVRDPGKPEHAALRRDHVELVGFDAVTATDAERAVAVRGAFAVVSALQGGPEVIIEAQLALARAAKAAGARRFLPSDFSYNLFTLPAGINVNTDWRRALAERARGEVTPTFEVVHVMPGIFADRGVLGFLGVFDAERDVVRYWGDGATPIDWTTLADTARFTAAAALDDGAVPERFFIAGERLSILGLADAWQAAHHRSVSRERLGSLAELVAETQRRLTAEPANMYAWLPLMYAQGVFGGQALLGDTVNRRYPQIHAETVAQAIARGAI
jgi:nucleoside-diphosphate-sugar epimerase